MCKYCEEEKKLEERKDDNIYFTMSMVLLFNS